jgi:hypothetical protein
MITDREKSFNRGGKMFLGARKELLNNFDVLRRKNSLFNGSFSDSAERKEVKKGMAKKKNRKSLGKGLRM